MIRYALECACGARFEAWFKNAESCDAQLSGGAVTCPVCAGGPVSKALMAPSVTKGSAPPQTAPAPAPKPPQALESAESAEAAAPSRYAPSPARLIEEKLRAFRAHVEATAEPVGRHFAQEARAIHEGEAEERAIYGEATPAEAEALLQEGVPVAPIPWINRTDD